MAFTKMSSYKSAMHFNCIHFMSFFLYPFPMIVLLLLLCSAYIGLYVSMYHLRFINDRKCDICLFQPDFFTQHNNLEWHPFPRAF